MWLAHQHNSWPLRVIFSLDLLMRQDSRLSSLSTYIWLGSDQLLFLQVWVWFDSYCIYCCKYRVFSSLYLIQPSFKDNIFSILGICFSLLFFCYHVILLVVSIPYEFSCWDVCFYIPIILCYLNETVEYLVRHWQEISE